MFLSCRLAHPEARPAAFSAAGGAARAVVPRCGLSYRRVRERMLSFYVPPADQSQLLERLSDELVCVCVRALFDTGLLPLAIANHRKNRLHLQVSHEGTTNKTW